jgi:hypothetical protein
MGWEIQFSMLESTNTAQIRNAKMKRRGSIIKIGLALMSKNNLNSSWRCTRIMEGLDHRVDDVNRRKYGCPIDRYNIRMSEMLMRSM